MVKERPSIETLRRFLTCDAEMGELYWREIQRRPDLLGRRAGGMSSRGYRCIRLLGFTLPEHSVIWAMHHGYWPDGVIDHANGDPLDNRISNLRAATPSQNAMNRRTRSGQRSPYKGTNLFKGRWQARITKDGKLIYLGLYASAEEAAAAYDNAAREIQGEFARLNFPSTE